MDAALRGAVGNCLLSAAKRSAHLASIPLLLAVSAATAGADSTPVPTKTPIPAYRGSAGQLDAGAFVALAATPTAGITVRRDVTYCVAGRIPLKLDVYSPGGTSARPRGLVLYVHGGAFISGDKNTSTARTYMRDLASRGFVAASVNYRLAPAFQFSAMLEDVKCAVRYFRANSGAYNIDPLRIGIMGSSVGGQLASLVGVTDRRAGFEGNGGYLNQSSRVRAVVDLFGYADMTVSMPRGLRERNLMVFRSVDGLALGSPVTHITSDDPPFLIMHGDHDRTVPLSQSELFARKLRAANVPVEFYMVTNVDHGFSETGTGPVRPSAEMRLKIIGDFFERTLR